MINAASRFLESAAIHSARPALWLNEHPYSYAELAQYVSALAQLLHDLPGARCAVLGERSLTAYCAPLACLLAGKTYIPLGASFPVERMQAILTNAQAELLLADPTVESSLQALLSHLDTPLTVVRPEHEGNSDGLPAGHASLDGLWQQLRPGSVSVLPQPLATADIAYLLYTSGSTGLPKGVMIGHGALDDYVSSVLQRYPELDPEQRCSQFFEPTFDLSLHDMFVTWAAGACLYSIPKKELFLPLDFVRRHEITVWFSVPSLLATLVRYRQLTPNCVPSLRLALFCGEALPVALALQWMQAAPQARCENLYGPTEATIACTAWRMSAAETGAVVPIGQAFPSMEIAVLDENGVPAAPGQAGELYLGGSQLALGYWNDPAQTARRFVTRDVPPYRSTRWYRSGDLALLDETGIAHFRGRVDRQVKVRGYRIELQDVEAHLRQICATTEVAVLALPPLPCGTIPGLAAFVVDPPQSAGTLLACCRERLPAYMVPGAIHAVPALPLNSNGKTDYGQLAQRLSELLQQPDATRPLHASTRAPEMQVVAAG
ncbi:MAG: amino acid adenylation domain-containing protein [Rhodanobacteraceae bacterium]|nr:amino acid adenylation domain-containing protein [Rhodanobacteraceae bacterium]